MILNSGILTLSVLVSGILEIISIMLGKKQIIFPT